MKNRAKLPTTPQPQSFGKRNGGWVFPFPPDSGHLLHPHLLVLLVSLIGKRLMSLLQGNTIQIWWVFSVQE